MGKALFGSVSEGTDRNFFECFFCLSVMHKRVKSVLLEQGDVHRARVSQLVLSQGLG